VVFTSPLLIVHPSAVLVRVTGTSTSVLVSGGNGFAGVARGTTCATLGVSIGVGEGIGAGVDSDSACAWAICAVARCCRSVAAIGRRCPPPSKTADTLWESISATSTVAPSGTFAVPATRPFRTMGNMVARSRVTCFGQRSLCATVQASQTGIGVEAGKGIAVGSGTGVGDTFAIGAGVGAGVGSGASFG